MFENNVQLNTLSNYKIGGPAKFFFQSSDIVKLSDATVEAKKRKLPIFILGGGTNLLFSDEGFDGLVIKPLMNDINLFSKGSFLLRDRLITCAR